MSEKLKQLTGKNPKDFEPVSYSLVNTPDVELFAELVEKDDFLYDFIKQNVSNRLEKQCNQKNYPNLLKFLKYYSPSYEEFIIKQLVKYSDEDLTDTMLEIFENGNDNEKTYCAKYFSFVKDPLALDFLKQNAYSEDSYLSSNCISALASFKDRELFNEALQKLNSDDEFEQLAGTKFLVSYGDKSVCDDIIKTIKKSSFAEHIAAELPYLTSIEEIICKDSTDGLYVLNNIISGFGEVSCLSQVFDFGIYEIMEELMNNEINSVSAVVLLNAKDKFDTLTENDEYLFDETKDIKQEIIDIKNLLSTLNTNDLIKIADNELKSKSLFVYTALDYTNNVDKVRNLLCSDNPTLILKSIEILKKLNALTQKDKDIALQNTSNDNIKNIILAL